MEFLMVAGLLLAVIVIIILAFVLLRERIYAKVWPKGTPGTKRKKQELTDIERETVRETASLKMRPDRRDEISIEPLIKKRKKKSTFKPI